MTREGVIKFSSNHNVCDLDEAATAATLRLIGWRNVLRRAGLLGIDPERYDGVGFGNVSVRLDATSFVVSGTQTSPIERAEPEHFVCIDSWNIGANWVTSAGPVRPSSETMTHAMLYALDTQISCVLHVHSPEIWNAWQRLALPVTPRSADYGTPEMAQAVRDLYDAGALESRVFVMLGHEDGIVVFGPTVEDAAHHLLDLFANVLTEDGS